MHAVTNVNTADPRWKALYTIGSAAAVAMLALMPIRIIVFVIYPPPDTLSEYFVLFQENWLLGLLSLDLLYILNNVLLSVIYLALYFALQPSQEALMALALALGLLGIAAYFSSNTAFEMLALSHQFAAATTEAQRTIVLAAGQSMLAISTGTAFNMYYVLNAVVLLIISAVMLRSPVFSRATAYAGLVAGILMTVPSTAGTIGLVSALASLAPWALFSLVIARRSCQLGQSLSRERRLETITTS